MLNDSGRSNATARTSYRTAYQRTPYPDRATGIPKILDAPLPVRWLRGVQTSRDARMSVGVRRTPHTGYGTRYERFKRFKGSESLKNAYWHHRLSTTLTP